MEPGMTDNPLGDYSSTLAGDIGDELADDLRALIKGELEPGERLLWAARSHPPFEPPSAGFYVSFSIAMLFFGVGLAIVSRQRNRVFVDDTALIYGLSLLGIGCLVAIGMVAAWNSRRSERRRLSRVRYAVTDRRAIIWTPEPKGVAIRIQTLFQGQIRTLVRVERPDGSGSLEFSRRPVDLDFEWPVVGFQHIPDVRRVEQIIRNNLINSDQLPLDRA